MATHTVRKPVSGQGLLGREASHVAWVTNDMSRAVAIFTDRYGVREFRFIEGAMPAGGQIKVAFAWAGGQILEIICASGPGTAFYNEMLPQGEFAIRFHHLGFIVHDQSGWDDLGAELKAGKSAIVHETQTGSFIDAYYIKAPELGHYIEYIRPLAAGIDFYAAVPAN